MESYSAESYSGVLPWSPTVECPAVDTCNGESYSGVLQWSPTVRCHVVESCRGSIIMYGYEPANQNFTMCVK